MRRSVAAATADVAAFVPPPLSDEAARRFAKHIARRHFGGAARQLRQLGGGLTNSVFMLNAGGRVVVLRMNADVAKIQDFQKEAWAMDRARERGVPTPEVLEVATQSGGPAYMVQAAVSGVAGHEHPERVRIAERLGGYARLIHEIRTDGDGPVFDWSSNRLSRHESWAGFLDDGLHAIERVEALARQKMIAPKQAEAALKRLAEMRAWRRPSALQHGDLRLKNTIVDEASGEIRALIDWESCVSGPPPFWDLSIALHDLGVDAKEAFLCGYGLTPRRYAALAPYVAVLNLVNYAGEVKHLAAARDRVRLDWLRARLHGLLDLHLPDGVG